MPAGLIDIPGVDRLCASISPRQTMQVRVRECAAQLAMTLGDKFLRIVKANDAPLGVQNDGCGDEPDKQGAAPRFI